MSEEVGAVNQSQPTPVELQETVFLEIEKEGLKCVEALVLWTGLEEVP